MKKIAALLLFSCQITLASNAGPDNLKHASLCFNISSINLSPEANILAPGIKSEVFRNVSNKLKAYRIPYSKTCDITNQIISLEFYLSEKSKIDIYAFTSSLNVIEFNLKPRGVSIYNLGGFGTIGANNAKNNSLISAVTSEFSQSIDEFAADYATANP